MLVSGEKTLLIDNLSHADGAKGAEIYLHTELKVAVRTCEGKAIHGISQNNRLHVSTRNITHAKTQRGAEIYLHTECTE